MAHRILSFQVVTPETMLRHLESLEAEGHEALVFLKHLSTLAWFHFAFARLAGLQWNLTWFYCTERLEVLEWHADASEPVLRYACSVDNPSDSYLTSRSLFSRAPAAARSAVSDVYQLQLLVDRPLSNQHQRHCYLISQQKGGALTFRPLIYA